MQKRLITEADIKIMLKGDALSLTGNDDFLGEFYDRRY